MLPAPRCGECSPGPDGCFSAAASWSPIKPPVSGLTRAARGILLRMTVRPAPRLPGPSMAARAKWLLRARPGDYMLALSMATASLPVVGKHLEPLGGVTAMGVWGYRHIPGFLSTSAKSWFTPGIAEI